MAAHEAFMARQVGALRGGNRLHPSDTATSVRHCADGGVAVSAVPDLDEALRIAVLVPAPFGGVEVRPVRTAG